MLLVVTIGCQRNGGMPMNSSEPLAASSTQDREQASVVTEERNNTTHVGRESHAEPNNRIQDAPKDTFPASAAPGDVQRQPHLDLPPKKMPQSSAHASNGDGAKSIESVDQDEPIGTPPSTALQTARVASRRAAVLINKAKTSRREAENMGHVGVLPIEQVQANEEYRKAIELYRQAADEAPEAVYTEMATLHCIMSRFAEGFDCAEIAAKHGSAVAMSLLGHLYMDGNGVEADATKAFRWFL
jgi:hypothetical protein